MSPWSKQKGFPLVIVESATREGTAVKLCLSQKKFSAVPYFKGKNFLSVVCIFNNFKIFLNKYIFNLDDDTLWTIPLQFSTKSKPNKPVNPIIFEGQQAIIAISDVSKDDWIKVNAGAATYVRVKYPKSMIDQFIPSIKDKSMPVMDRLQILDDLYAMVLILNFYSTEQ